MLRAIPNHEILRQCTGCPGNLVTGVTVTGIFHFLLVQYVVWEMKDAYNILGKFSVDNDFVSGVHIKLIVRSPRTL